MYKQLFIKKMGFNNGKHYTTLASESIRKLVEAMTDDIYPDIYERFIDENEAGEKTYFIVVDDAENPLNEGGDLTAKEIQNLLMKGKTIIYYDMEMDPVKLWVDTIKCIVE